MGKSVARVGFFVVAAVTLVVMASLTVASFAGEAAGRPKILGIAYVKVMVTDMEKAKAFYGDVLGLNPSRFRNRNDAQATFLVNAYQSVVLVRTTPGTTGSYLGEIGLATDDLMKMRAYLTAKGIPAGKIMTKTDGPMSFETQDPEGNKIVFVVHAWDGAEAGSPGAISHKLLHAGFVVKDWKAENRFYEDVLGFRLYWKGGFQDDGLDWYEIQAPDGDNWIEYMLNIPANADHKELGVQNHFSLGVASANAAAAELRARGLKEFDGPEIGRDGKNAIDAYDPDGTRVELMEFVPTGKPCCAEYSRPHPEP